MAQSHDVSTEVLRDTVRQMLAGVIECEVAAWIDDHAHLKDETGRCQVVRATALGTLSGPSSPAWDRPRSISPRVLDRRSPEPPAGDDHPAAILPLYLRRTKSLDQLIPRLYLPASHPQRDFPEVFQALLGPDASRPSANTASRLKTRLGR